jgi:uncharacterized protein DUF1360
MSRWKTAARTVRDRYEGGESRPLAGYVAAMTVYGGVVAGLAGVGKLRGARLPTRFGLGDTVLLGVATHKASRVLAKESVTSPLRAPFTRFEGPAGEGEVMESVTATGAGHSVGELLTCPFCLAVWVSTGLGAGLVLAPRVTRLASTVLAAVSLSDVLQLVYDAIKKLPERTGGRV